ncbi:IpaD/SipD/SspD family type III secretion system needle tip protein [Proteus hauseri]|uniref:IpaD/SipD/SspD family type III secretion system needle tip protein n=1 Tax=Proteus hauseri TaxID=183417 RepID=UPI0032DAA34C
MSSQAISNVNSLEYNKKLLTENHSSENSRYIGEKGDMKFAQEDFNQEGYKVKEKLQNKINDFIPMKSTYLVSNYSLKEEEMINRNKYARNINNTKILEQEISKIQHADAKVNGRSGSNTDSLHDFFKEVKDSIVTGKSDYLDILKDIFSKYMDYVNKLRTILSQLSEMTKAGEKDNTVNVDFFKLFDALKDLRDNYTENPNSNKHFFKMSIDFIRDEDGRYFRVIDGEKIYYEDVNQVNNAIDAIKDLFKGIKGFNFKPNINDFSPSVFAEFTMAIDFHDLDKIIENVKRRAEGDHDILQSEFNLFKNSLDALEKKINTNLDELSKKYSAANSNYDNFVKIVSSTMNTLLEMAKGFLRF